MAISGKTFRPMDSGTVYGVPYRYSMERDEYILPDGAKFHDQHELIDYVQRNLKSFEQTVLGRRHRMTPDELNDRRLFIVTENKKRQLKWDKQFNRKVVSLVTQAIEQGGCTLRVAKMVPFQVSTYGAADTTISSPSYETYDIHYDKWLPEVEAYARCREQAEDAVRHALPPPDLLPMV
jgi:hypothetical protein